MTSPTLDFSAPGVIALLRGQGLRITRSRQVIVQALFASGRPISLTEIQNQARAEHGVLPDYATVFRMMILLESLNLVRKVNLRRSCSYYELTDPSKHHDHLICTQCGKVVRLETPAAIEETSRRLEAEHGYTGLHHSLEFFGWCPECTAAVNAAVATPVPA